MAVYCVHKVPVRPAKASHPEGTNYVWMPFRWHVKLSPRGMNAYRADQGHKHY